MKDTAMIRSNPHTHTPYVDGKSTPREMIDTALSLGFVSLGFSEHAAQAGIDSVYGLDPSRRRDYLNEIRALAREYASRLTIRVGLEIDRLSTDSPEDLDYFLAANHYFASEDGDWAAVDGDPDSLESYVDRHFGGSWDTALKTYFEQYAAHVCRIKPTIIAHLDLICKGNRKRHWFDEAEGPLIEYGKAAMDQMITACDLMEVNTGGMARSGQPCPYPVQPLLKYWHDLGGRVIPSSDCHRCRQLAPAFDTTEDYLRRAGFTEYLILSPGKALFETVAL